MVPTSERGSDFFLSCMCLNFGSLCMSSPTTWGRSLHPSDSYSMQRSQVMSGGPPLCWLYFVGEGRALNTVCRYVWTIFLIMHVAHFWEPLHELSYEMGWEFVASYSQLTERSQVMSRGPPCLLALFCGGPDCVRPGPIHSLPVCRHGHRNH